MAMQNTPFKSQKPFSFSRFINDEKNQKTILSLLVGAGLLVGGFYGYRYYQTAKNQKAQRILSEVLSEYERALETNSVEAWGNLASLAALGYQQHKSAGSAAYFLAIESEAVRRQGDYQKAFVLLDQAIAGVPSRSAVNNLYKTKQALMKIDNADAGIKQQGLDELIALGSNSKNSNRDLALYYVGYYYWVNDNLVQAEKAWNELIALDSTDKRATSPWAVMAQSKLQQVTV